MCCEFRIPELEKLIGYKVCLIDKLGRKRSPIHGFRYNKKIPVPMKLNKKYALLTELPPKDESWIPEMVGRTAVFYNELTAWGYYFDLLRGIQYSRLDLCKHTTHLIEIGGKLGKEIGATQRGLKIGRLVVLKARVYGDALEGFINGNYIYLGRKIEFLK